MSAAISSTISDRVVLGFAHEGSCAMIFLIPP
jgi:hypothetical protein